MTKRHLIFWIVLACGLCLIPSSWLTDLEGALVPATKDSSKAALLWREAREPLAHGLLMFGVGYSLMRFLSARLAISQVEDGSGECVADQVPISGLGDISPSQVSEEKGSCLLMLFRGNLLISVSCVIVLSILIEGAQALLPASFSRGYAWGDLWASLVGGLLGSLIAMGRSLAARAMRHINKSEESKY
ncbi:hypothetical protein OAF62_00750 [Akkermansiaceae bacterium]|nr:hypothetical protein [Akkermansiaceae bacterium]